MMASRLGLIILLIILVFGFTIAFWLFPNSSVLIVIRSFQIASSIAVVWAYWPALKRVIREGFRGNADQLLSSAIVLGYVAMGVNAFWIWLWRGALEEHWMVDAAINGYCVVLSSWTAIMYSAAPGTVDGEITKSNKYMLLVLFLGTVVLSIVGLTGTPVFKWIEQTLKPYMAEDSSKAKRFDKGWIDGLKSMKDKL